MIPDVHNVYLLHSPMSEAANTVHFLIVVCGYAALLCGLFDEKALVLLDIVEFDAAVHIDR